MEIGNRVKPSLYKVFCVLVALLGPGEQKKPRDKGGNYCRQYKKNGSSTHCLFFSGNAGSFFSVTLKDLDFPTEPIILKSRQIKTEIIRVVERFCSVWRRFFPVKTGLLREQI